MMKTLLKSDKDMIIDEKLESQNDEFGDLTRTFKGMVEKIKTSLKCPECGGVLPNEIREEYTIGNGAYCEHCGYFISNNEF